MRDVEGVYRMVVKLLIIFEVRLLYELLLAELILCCRNLLSYGLERSGDCSAFWR